MALTTILYLYLCFRAKQFMCDFLLQSGWMAMTKGDNDFIGYKALGIHVGIHALGTLLVCLVFAPAFWWLAVIDFVLHGIIDKTKASIVKKYNWHVKDSKFWWAFGLDQELHNLTHLGYVIIIAMS